MDAEQVIAFISSLVPTITAVASMIVSVIVAIKRVGSLKDDTIQKMRELSIEILEDSKEAKEETKQVRNELAVVLKENAELKKQLQKTSKVYKNGKQ